MLSDVWVRTESPNNDPNMSKNRLLSLFKKAQPQFLMDKDEYEAFQNLEGYRYSLPWCDLAQCEKYKGAVMDIEL